jgi:hypothetical protein
METKFASPNRSSNYTLQQSHLSLNKISYLNNLFCSLSYIFCILDPNRQIVFSNDILLKRLGLESTQQVLGKRFGEAINCLYSSDEEGGCGTSEHCRYCGATNAILKCQETGLKANAEARIRVIANGIENFLDVEVTASPFIHENVNYTVFSLIDISDRKRRAIIEKIFYHDVMNVAGGLRGFFDIFNLLNEEDREKYLQIGASLSQQIIEEISAQRQLAQAESHELEIHLQPIESLSFMQQIANDLQFLEVAKEKNIIVDQESLNVSFESDSVLLRRVLNNMVKNALEASTAGQTVTLAVNKTDQKLKFSVHNSKFITRDIEMQVFMRTFSTKGPQRGLGTYSMKILGEQSLGGTVNFTTSETEGTTFFIIL